MTIEYLFSEIGNLYGEHFNIRYLRDCLPDAQVVYTSLTDKPHFLDEKVDLVYMGTMPEFGQQLAIKRLLPYRDEIRTKIEQGQIFLCTGNAMEIFGRKITEEGKTDITGLGLFSMYAVRRMMQRYNGLYLGSWVDLQGHSQKIVGFKSQFSMSYENNQQPLFQTIRGCGMNENETGGGIHWHNFMGTYCLGPLLVLNPYFTMDLERLMGVQEPVLAAKENALAAYRKRLAQFEDPDVEIQ